MERNRYMRTAAAIVGAPLFLICIPAVSSGQCCQTPCGMNVAPTPAIAKNPSEAPAKRCCSQAKTWRQYFEPKDSRAGTILDVAEHTIAKLSEFYERVTFGENSTKWSSWCRGKSTTGPTAPCTPKCCQKPATDTTSKPQANTKDSG